MRLSLSMISSFFTLYNRRRFRISAMTLVDTKESSRDTRILRIQHYHKQSTAVTIIDWETNDLGLERQPQKVEGVHSSCSMVIGQGMGRRGCEGERGGQWDIGTASTKSSSESDIDPTTNFVQLPSECDFEQVSEAESNTHTSAVSDHNIEAVGLNILSSNVLSEESENEYFTESGVSNKTTSFVDSSSEADDTDEDPNYIPSDVESNNSEEIEQSTEEELV
ncbi:hypothetical protein J6590_062055 [Homalodisca vitripennis]|nr:hypothetical protein J6590_062055 [Homalodisca vitripennis]